LKPIIYGLLVFIVTGASVSQKVLVAGVLPAILTGLLLLMDG
jgi:hypothetical protein